MQDIPLAVSAFDSAQLERIGVRETLDVTRLIPNMTGGNNTGLGSANVHTIRGLNNTESIATFDPPVGSYIDEDNQTDFADLIFGTVFADRIMGNTTEAWAVYAQGDYALTDQLTLTAGIRYTDEKKELDFIPNSNPAAAIPGFSSADIAAMEIGGLEIEALGLVTDRLSVFANVGLLDGRYTDLLPEVRAQQQRCIAAPNPDDCGSGIIQKDGSIARLQRQPELTAVVGFDYAMQIGPNFELVPSAAFTRYGRHTVGTSDEPVAAVSGYNNLIASLSLEDMDDEWSVRVECKSCTNRDQLVSTLAGQRYYNMPRTWQTSFRYNF